MNGQKILINRKGNYENESKYCIILSVKIIIGGGGGAYVIDLDLQWPFFGYYFDMIRALKVLY